MEDPGCGLADTAMEPPESAWLQAAMEFPVTASFGPMGPLLRQLQSLPKGVEDDKIQLLKDTIGGLCISLVDVSEAKDAGLAAKWWIKEVRELCYDTEDYLGEVMKQKQSRVSTIFRVGRKVEWRPQAQIGRRAQGRSSASRLREVCTKRRNRKPQPRKIVTSFLELMARAEVLDDVSERFNHGHKANKPDCAQADVSRLTPRLHHQPLVLPTAISVHRDAGCNRLVGVEEPVNKLANLLAFDDDNQKQLKVVCILGFPGVGKTTVAKTLHHNFRGKFQCRAFVRVTRTPDMIMILTSILKQTKAPQVRSFPDAQDLIDHIREHLQGKRYFIVIDDLWTISAWNIISRAFPDDNCCSRILTTTGSEDISLACSGYCLTNIFEMSPLSYVQSRELFFDRLFHSKDGCSPSFREVLGIIKKCGGSPLATVCLASLIAWEPNLAFEENIQGSSSSSASTYSTSEGMKEVLNLIYNDLPPDMKTCLLHLGIYPEGYTIRKDDLVKQWVAEGFLNTIEGQDTKKIAGAYFDELVTRGIVHAVDTNYNGEVLLCTVHQMVLDFIRDKSIEENFAITVDCFQSALPLPDKVRRLSVQFGGAKGAKIPGGIIVSQARSLMFCGFFKCVPSISDYGLLRVLILHIWADEGKTSDLTRVCELFHLTYLNIECNITIKLPAKIRGLQYLGTLEVDARLSAVPSDIVHLKKLLHLRLPSECNLPYGVGRLASLRTLGYFDIGGNSVDNVMDLGKLTNLQDLQLTCSTLQPVENLEKNMQLLGLVLEKLSILQSVTLIHTAHSSVTASSMSISCDSLSRVSHAPALLERIELLPRIFIFPSLPKWFEQLGRLRILKIAVRELCEEGIDILKALPGLTALTLYVQTAPSERIVFDKRGFFFLKYFNFRCSVSRLKFEAGAMPNLLKLKLSFNAARVEQEDTPAISIERLSALEEISTKIGGAGGDAQSALTATITNHASNPRIIVRLVDWFSYGDASTLTKEKQQTIKDKDQVEEKEETNDSRAETRSQLDTMDESAELEAAASVLMMRWASTPAAEDKPMLFDGAGDRAEAERFLRAVDVILRRLATVGRRLSPWVLFVQPAMARLKDEFRHVLSSRAFDLDIETLAELSDRSNSVVEDNPVSYCVRRRSIREIDLLPDDAVADLRAIASRIAAAGYSGEVAEVYASVRKPIVDASLRLLGVEQLSIVDVHRLQWDAHEDEVRRWIRAARAAVRVVFASERRLSLYIFHDLPMSNVSVHAAAPPATHDTPFVDAVEDAALELFGFADAISMGPCSPERLFKMIDLHDALSDLLPDFSDFFAASKAAESIYMLAVETRSRLADEVRGILSEFENAVLHDTHKTHPVPGGTVHPLTRYVMNYSIQVSDCRAKLTKLIVSRPSASARLAAEDTEPGPTMSDLQLPELENQSPLAAHMIWILVVLEHKLEGKASLYKDTALSHLFLMNNVHYIVQKVKDSPGLRSMIGDDYLKRLTGKFRVAATNYQRISLLKILDCLRDEGLHVSRGSSSGISKSALRVRFKSFNAAFEDAYSVQPGWLLEDMQLREELRISILEKLLPAYRSFLGRFGHHIENEKHPELYIKHSAEDLENAVNDFFEGATPSPHNRRNQKMETDNLEGGGDNSKQAALFDSMDTQSNKETVDLSGTKQGGGYRF